MTVHPERRGSPEREVIPPRRQRAVLVQGYRRAGSELPRPGAAALMEPVGTHERATPGREVTVTGVEATTFRRRTPCAGGTPCGREATAALTAAAIVAGPIVRSALSRPRLPDPGWAASPRSAYTRVVQAPPRFIPSYGRTSPCSVSVGARRGSHAISASGIPNSAPLRARQNRIFERQRQQIAWLALGIDRIDPFLLDESLPAFEISSPLAPR